jgi:hypothetical protein
VSRDLLPLIGLAVAALIPLMILTVGAQRAPKAFAAALDAAGVAPARFVYALRVEAGLSLAVIGLGVAAWWPLRDVLLRNSVIADSYLCFGCILASVIVCTIANRMQLFKGFYSDLQRVRRAPKRKA